MTHNRISVLIATFLLILPLAFGQSQFASLSGTVTDSSGAVAAGANVTVKNAASGELRKAVTNHDGFFSLSTVPAGTYQVIVEMKGFQKWVGTGVVLNGSDTKTMNIELKVGAANETIEVNAIAQEVATVDSGEKSALISSKDLQDLSLVGRNATEYLKLLPGATLQANSAINRPAYDGQVVGINGFAVGNSAAGLGAVLINGQGIDITQDGQHSFDPGSGTATPVNPNPNMISEVKVLTSNFSAENAKGPVVVNTVTKGGGSAFHGEAYMYARNQAMNSEDALNESTEKVQGLASGSLKIPSSYYYPGFNIGGPLYIPGTGFNKSKRKLFFFEAYENYHQDLDGGLDRSFVMTPDMLNGDFSALAAYGNKIGHGDVSAVPAAPAAGTRLGFDARTGCTITGGVLSQACIDPNAQRLLTVDMPAPNSDPSISGFNYIQAFSVAQNSWQNVVRGDWDISDNTKVYVTWSRQRETANMPMGLWINTGDWTVPAPSNAIGANGSDAAGVSFMKVFSPTMTSETRFGYTRVNFPTVLADLAKQTRAGVGYNSTGIFGSTNTPAVVSWGQSMPNLGDVGHDYHPSMIAIKGIPSVSENLTKVFKTHTMKFGFYYEHLYNKQDNWGQFMGAIAYGATGWGGGTTGNEYADALMGVGQGGYFEQALPPPTNLAQNVAAWYAQDDWKITRRITINYGMRFEHYAKPYSDPFGLAVFYPNQYDPSIPAAQNTETGISWHSLDHNVSVSGANSRFLFFSPRVGAAIDIFGTGKTILRGGWGKYRYYDSVQSNSYVQPAQTATGSSSWSCGWNDPLCPTWEDVDAHALTPPVYGTGLAAGANKGVFVMDPTNDEQPLVTSYSLTIDQQLPSKFRLELSYVGNHTDFMQGYTNFYNAIPLGTITPATAAQFPADCNPGGNPDGLGSTACEQHFRRYPDYTTINESITAGKAQFDSLQASVHRNVGLLTLQANYTFSKALGDGAQLSNGGLPGSLTPEQADHWLWGVLPNNRAHALSVAYVLNLPTLHQGNAFLRGAASGWQISGITQISSGAQLTSQAGTNLNFALTQNGVNQDNVHLLGTPDITLYPLITCNPAKGLAKNQFINPNCFAPNPAGQLGDANMPYLPGPKFWNSDLTLIKNFKITERQALQFRFAAFNFLNHDLLSFVNNDNNLKLTLSPTGQPNSNFGLATSYVGHRILEVGAKYSF
jgi:Carboxypeptidase regulatory-like domain